MGAGASKLDKLVLDCEKNNIKCSRILKLFYKKYPYKLVMSGEYLKSSQRPPPSYKKEKLGTYALLMLHLGSCFGKEKTIDLLDNNDIKIYNSQSTNIFFKNEDEFIKFVQLSKEYIKEISVIESTDLLELLDNDHEVIFKKQYYFKKFPFRVQMSSYTVDASLEQMGLIIQETGNRFTVGLRYRYDAVFERHKKNARQEYFEDWAKDNLQNPFQRCRVRGKQEVPTIFFLECQDVILFKMQFTDYITNIDRITLLDQG